MFVSARPTHGAIHRPRVLLVEDHAVNREVMSRRLKRRGYDVISAKDGLEALEKVDALQFDLVLLDLTTPKIDGWSVAKNIKSSTTTAHIPVIALMTQTLGEDRSKAIDAGCDDYASKPVDFVELMRILNRLLPKRIEA